MKRIIKADVTGETYQPQTMPLDLDDVAAEAKRLLAHARRQADRIVADAMQEAAAVAAEARQKGYAEGLTRGRREAFVEGRRNLHQQAGEKLATDSAELTQLAQKAVGELAAARQSLLQQAKEQLLDLAIDIASKVVACQAAHNLDVVRANLGKCLQRLHETQQVTVHVNPAQLDPLQKSLPHLAAAIEAGNVRLAADPSVTPGGVKVTSGRGVIDATIETQLCNVVNSLKGPGFSLPAGQEPESDHERF